MRNRQHFEFFGPYFGPTGIIFGLPLVCYLLAIAVEPTDITDLSTYGNITPLVLFIGFEAVGIHMLAVIALHILLPARKAEGTRLSNGSRLQYRLNSLLAFLLIYCTVFYLSFIREFFELYLLHFYWIPCLTSSVILSFSLSIYLFFSSFKTSALLAQGGQTGYHWYDFFIGRELNPRIGWFDLKEFCELYPGLIGWTLLNLSNAHHQFYFYGHLTNSMILINLFQFVYVFDALYFEKSILTTMDITNDGFGFMLAFGDLTWVPFTYSLQSKFLAHNPLDLSYTFASVIFVLFAVGYWIFRGSNSQKDQFRRDPNHPSVKHLKTLETKSGKKLIISSWWGLARHINYTGDWLMGLSWCLCCGFQSPVPYFYAIYFGILLIHRDLRDQEACKKKYGSDWDRYCSIVPYRFIPYLY